MIVASNTKRPRNVDAPRAAAILYGDWGTSKAYVIGLAFAVAGYASFWLIAAMCVLTALVGVNYICICRHYPDGGGVYASVRHRSEIISIVGAFLLVADYIVTAAISALSAFQYLNWPHPEWFAGASIALIGALNYFGPKHTGGLAFLISMPTLVVVVILGALCLPHLGEAVRNVQAPHGSPGDIWKGFVAVVLALSGVEAIANSTGVMKLNPGSTDANPSVSQTSTKAIVWVMIEVCLFTALLGLAMHALPGLVINGDDVDAPGGHKGVRDYMLRYMGEVFGGGFFGARAGAVFGMVVSVVFGGLLLSAVNTAIVDLISISYLMSRDGELPPAFQKLNPFGVPNMGIIVATVVPAILVIAVKDVSGLADLYAVGVVGAIATNLGATSTDGKMRMARWERGLMFCTFLVMLAIEVTLFVTKPGARVFAVSVLAIGLILRGIASERSQKRKKEEAERAGLASAPAGPVLTTEPLPGLSTVELSGTPMLCAVRGVGRTLDFAIEEARESSRALYLLFVREQPLITAEDQRRKWQEDPDAREIFDTARQRAQGHPVIPCYAVSDSAPDTIVDIAATLGVSRLVLGSAQRNSIARLLRGDLIRKVSDILPENIHLLICA
jgi:amino acid transporter/nucleotide-binding universal stress UspA family protein